jgi:hypothetical protein
LIALFLALTIEVALMKKLPAPRNLSNKGKRNKGTSTDEDSGNQLGSENDKADISISSNKNFKKGKIIIPVRKESLSAKLGTVAANIHSNLRQHATKTLASITKVNRMVKTYFSSDFEQLLLHLTEPIDRMPKENELTSFIETLQSFSSNVNLKSKDNPYRVTLHKLWKKITENEYQTKLKALYLFHILLKSSKIRDGQVFQKQLFQMMKEQCPNNPTKAQSSKYFNSKITPSNSLFLTPYYKYLLLRGILFTCSFEELKEISYKFDINENCISVS